ncbi:hypothetical protein KCU81_g2585, partial [Aureobasidium melanogenum]|uniref:C2H2-type domain-containing protein n=1 Tax=Aureobasidium melanogenum (strain CBS 110374) TaxID=1043003 RepID=A0A074VQ55_AURM1
MTNQGQRDRSASSSHLSPPASADSFQPFSNPYDTQQQFQANNLNQQQFLDPQATLLDFQSPSFDNSSFFSARTPSLYSPNGSSSNLSGNLSPTSLSATNLSLNGPSPHNLPQTESNSFPGFDFNQHQLDPNLLYGTSNPPPVDPMAATHHNPTPPHLLQPQLRRASQSPSPHASPSYHQASFNQVNRQRSESLDPASAAYPPPGYHGNDWGAGQAFQAHRRSPSDAYSEISSHSNQASPYLPTADSFDASPMLNPQADVSMFPDALGLGQFSLSDTQIPPHISPGPSPAVSPRLLPQAQQALPDFNTANGFALQPDMTYQAPQQNFDMYPNPSLTAAEPFPQLSSSGTPNEIGMADTMSPPEINIDFAPPSRVPSFGPPDGAGPEDALSPPERNRSRNRMRAKSDTFVGSRPVTPSVSGRGRSPSLQPGTNSLSPFDARHSGSRSPSPSSISSTSGLSRRSSTSSVPQRHYILDLANPERAASGGNDPKRTQKHPATFQCTLCPKKFTRAYNLRSHLRTHTDERPFVCTVCGKAFARQHDRKRHESLHSGEKKFVCKGQLSNGEQWGCGRRFARADALGRHFRSEAGRVCIKPLLDEEAAERQKQWAEEHAQRQMQSDQGFVAPPPMTNQPHLHPILPAALLQMYPDLANLDWGAVSAPAIPEESEVFSGRSSFDAGSGNEWDLSESEMGTYAQQTQNMNMGLANNGWASDMDR